MVREGYLTYRDINIIDTSRNRNVPFETYEITKLDVYGHWVSGDDFPNIILCVEKDTAVPIVKQISKLYGCSYISGKGQNAFSAMEDLLYEIREKLSYKNEPIPITFLVLSDYDPSGYIIADTFKKQAQYYQSLFNLSEIESYRIGINPNQLTVEELEQNKYTPKKAGLDKWFQETGGIHGEPYGLELDALTPSKIRELFLTSLKNYINEVDYQYDIKRSYIRRVALEAMEYKIEKILDSIIEEEEDNIGLKDFDMEDLAMNGYSKFPILKLCEMDRDEQIEEKAMSYFREEEE